MIQRVFLYLIIRNCDMNQPKLFLIHIYFWHWHLPSYNHNLSLIFRQDKSKIFDLGNTQFDTILDSELR